MLTYFSTFKEVKTVDTYWHSLESLGKNKGTIKWLECGADGLSAGKVGFRSEWRTIESSNRHQLTDFQKFGLLRNKKATQEERLRCGAEWIRTTDSRIFSPMLYQLSYSTKISVGKSR